MLDDFEFMFMSNLVCFYWDESLELLCNHVGLGMSSFVANSTAFVGHGFGCKIFWKYKKAEWEVPVLMPKSLEISAQILAYLGFFGQFCVFAELCG